MKTLVTIEGATMCRDKLIRKLDETLQMLPTVLYGLIAAYERSPVMGMAANVLINLSFQPGQPSDPNNSPSSHLVTAGFVPLLANTFLWPFISKAEKNEIGGVLLNIAGSIQIHDCHCRDAVLKEVLFVESILADIDIAVANGECLTVSEIDEQTDSYFNTLCMLTNSFCGQSRTLDQTMVCHVRLVATHNQAYRLRLHGSSVRQTFATCAKNSSP